MLEGSRLPSWSPCSALSGHAPTASLPLWTLQPGLDQGSGVRPLTPSPFLVCVPWCGQKGALHTTLLWTRNAGACGWGLSLWAHGCHAHKHTRARTHAHTYTNQINVIILGYTQRCSGLSSGSALRNHSWRGLECHVGCQGWNLGGPLDCSHAVVLLLCVGEGTGDLLAIPAMCAVRVHDAAQGGNVLGWGPHWPPIQRLARVKHTLALASVLSSQP